MTCSTMTDDTGRKEGFLSDTPAGSIAGVFGLIRNYPRDIPEILICKNVSYDSPMILLKQSEIL